ncbi:P1 family peptidase [Parvularcula lutaonensis]|uniref:P1 family peptidase n=1 Tax=Parvularcula lutaonensis TaxID=491923 RepID=A0ABV7MBF4_9PROT|nr:P1 family peptidase [Parvularcula lutaonensis]GGY44172.1 peptidase T4 [Parvularcula lutaonensis]
MKAGARNSITDVAGVKVGSARDENVRTGVTVLLPDTPMRAAVDVRGGGPGTRETDALALDTLVDRIDALVLSGGSVYGLGAADAVVAALGARRQGFTLMSDEKVPVAPIVPAAILFDLANGGDKAWGEEPPYPRLAREALAAVSEEVVPGAEGAGAGATAGDYPGGLGTASFVSGEGFTVGALAAVNSFGSPYVQGTKQFWAAPYEIGDEFGGRGFPQKARAIGFPPDTKAAAMARQNTTLVVVATDADLSAPDLKRLAVMAQDGLARALRPAHGPADGDIVFALSTSAKKVDAPLRTLTELGSIAGDVVARAIARGVFAAE